MGRSSQTQQRKGRLLFAKIKNAKPNEKVHFELSSKASKEAELVVEGTEQGLSGHLVRAEHRPWVYKDEPKDSIILYLSDPKAGEEGETYRIELSLGGLARTIINSLLSADHFDEERDIVTIRLYNNKKGYASAWVGLGIDGTGQAVALPWLLSMEDQSGYITKVKTKARDANNKIIDKVQNNYIELDAYLLKRFKSDIMSKMDQASAEEEEAEPADAAPVAVSAGATDDLPF